MCFDSLIYPVFLQFDSHVSKYKTCSNTRFLVRLMALNHCGHAINKVIYLPKMKNECL